MSQEDPMGYATVLVFDDARGLIPQDPQFAAKLAAAIERHDDTGQPVTFSANGVGASGTAGYVVSRFLSVQHRLIAFSGHASWVVGQGEPPGWIKDAAVRQNLDPLTMKLIKAMTG